MGGKATCLFLSIFLIEIISTQIIFSTSPHVKSDVETRLRDFSTYKKITTFWEAGALFSVSYHFEIKPSS